MILLPSHPGTTSNRRNVGAETKIPKDDKMFSNHQENRRGMLSVVNSFECNLGLKLQVNCARQ